MTMQIIWEKPTHISQHKVRDELWLKIIDPTILKDETGLTFRNRTVFTGSLPPQAILDETTDNLIYLIELAGNIIRSFLAGNIALHPIILYSLNSLWSLVNGL